MFHEAYGGTGYSDLESDLASLHKQSMCTCVEDHIHNHAVLNRGTWNVNREDPRLPHPLSIPIDASNTTMAELFLCAGVPATLMREHLTHPPMNGTMSIFWSAVEYACFLHQPDILRLLVAYDQSRRRYDICFLLYCIVYRPIYNKCPTILFRNILFVRQ